MVPSSVLIIIISLYSWLKVKKRENAIFFCLSLCQAIWALATFIMWKNCGYDSAVIFWDRVLYFAAALMIPLVFHFVIEICELGRIKKYQILTGLSYIFGLFFCFLSRTKYFVNGVFYYQWGCHTYAQIGHHFFLVYSMIFGSLALYFLFKTYRNKEINSLTRERAKYSLIAFFVFICSAIEMLVAYGLPIYPIFYLCFPVFSVIFTYAITEKNLFPSVVATDILVAIILILAATIFLFPEIELSILAKGGIFILLLFSCLLLLKHNHKEIQRKEEIERISKMKTEFISIVSHQLRTPLATIRGYSGMLKDGDFGPLSKEAETAIEHIHDSSIRMIKMINSLLNVTRIEKGKIELNIRDFSIVDLVQSCIDDLNLEAKEKGLYLKYIKPTSDIPLVRGDAEKIEQAISNILNNAILYTKKGGITIKVYLFQKCFVRIEIKDTGIGLESEDIEKLFTSFSRGKKGVEINVQGIGLGLYIAKSFIEMHKGKISVFSAGQGKGSTFYLDIPIKARINDRQKYDFQP